MTGVQTCALPIFLRFSYANSVANIRAALSAITAALAPTGVA